MSSRKDPFGNNMFDEKRTIPCISKYTHLPQKHWYTTWETTSTEYVYSEIELVNDTNSYIFPNGKTALLIGVNPRQTAADYVREVEEYLNSRKKNPDVKNRKTLAEKKEDALESFRRTALRELLIKEYKADGIKKLIIVDLFACRTKTQRELINLIKKKPDDIEKTIGIKNKENIGNLISSNEVDRIVIGWGGISPVIKFIPEYCQFLFDLLNDNITKVYWFGANKDGSPRHCSGAIELESLKQIKKSELKELFN